MRAEPAVGRGTVVLAANRLKREIIVRCPPARWMAHRRHEARLAAHRSSLPALDEYGNALVADLRRQGLALTNLDELAIPGTDSLKETLTRLVEELQAGSRVAAAGGSIRSSRARLSAEGALLSWGLAPRLLDIVENYLEQPPLYYPPVVRRDFAHSPPTGVRQWHRDAEDHRQVKLFVWLHDVGARGGAYEYIPARYSGRVVHELNYVSGYICDLEMEEIVPRNEWRRCPGRAWTVVLSDPAQVFHRQGPDAILDRYSLVNSYTSRHPLKRYSDEFFDAAEVGAMNQLLDSYQISCLACAPERRPGAIRVRHSSGRAERIVRPGTRNERESAIRE